MITALQHAARIRIICGVNVPKHFFRTKAQVNTRFPVAVSYLATLAGSALALLIFTLPSAAQSRLNCGELISIETREGSITRYTLMQTDTTRSASSKIALVLLVGGSGYLNLNDQGCPRLLQGNSLVRSATIFQKAGFITALVDAPSNYTGEDGLAGFRAAPAHAEDLGKVIADIRSRARAEAVWVIGTSRGTISAANVASRNQGASAPDGVVLTSALTIGSTGRKSWVAQTLYDTPLENIQMPVLVVGHAEDTCLRSPASEMPRILARTRGAREQMVTVTGGPPAKRPGGIEACEGRSPHGFVDQEAEVAEGITRFIRGGSY